MWDRSGVPPEIVTIETPELGDRSYVILHGTEAVVVDPQRDVGRVLAVLSDHSARLTHVLETHIHNDYVSGGPELSRITGAILVIPAGESVGYARQAIGDGGRIQVGALTLVARHTPGHTATHMAYLLEDDGPPVAAFTGGSMLLGSVGRTDLIGPWVTDRLSHLQHRSARRLSDELPDAAAILPTHGFGSLCSAGFPVGAPDTGDARHQRAENPALLMEEDAFVDRLVAGMDAFPRYYAYIAPRNREGAGGFDSELPDLSDGRALAERARAGEWVVDLRERRAFAARHLAGTLAFELSDPLSTYLGWLLPWGSPLSLIGRSLDDLSAARLALARIGIERIVACGISDCEGGEDPWAELPDRLVPGGRFRRPQAVPRRAGRDRRRCSPRARVARGPSRDSEAYPAPRASRPPRGRARGQGLGALRCGISGGGGRLAARPRSARRHGGERSVQQRCRCGARHRLLVRLIGAA